MADTFVLLDTLPPQFFKVESGKAVPLSGGSLESFASGTTTPQNVYDADGNSLGSTLTLDSRGEIMTVKNIWLKVGDDYKFRLKDADGVEVWTVDDITTDQGIRQFSDAITINVPSAKAPFVLNALAQGQLVTGLNADQVDGAHVGENNGDIVLRENLSSAAQQATESAQGVAEIATQAEVDTGTDDDRIVTPLKLKDSNFLKIPTSSTAPVLAFNTWRTPNADRPTLVFVEVATNTDGSTAAVVTLMVDEGGGTSADYEFRHITATGAGDNSKTNGELSCLVPAGGSYQIENTGDPRGLNTIEDHREFTL